MLKSLGIVLMSLALIGFHGDAKTQKAQQAQSDQKPATPVMNAPIQQNNRPSLQPESDKHVQADVRIVKTPEKDGYDIAAFWISVGLAGVGIAGVGIGICTLLFLRNQTIQIRRQADMATRQARLISTQAKQMEEQTRILRDSVAAAQKAAEATEKSATAAMGVAVPTVVLHKFSFIVSKESAATFYQNPRVRLELKNYGQSPALLRKYWLFVG